MIQISDKHNCCGCSACAQRCPKQCITMQEDNEGFLYPKVDESLCIGCGLCENICPEQNQYGKRTPIQSFAAINKNDLIRLQSSSGGVFSLLAERAIEEGGVVFGACFDDHWQVVIDYTETKEGLASFRGSKYVQARTGETYKQCEKFLKEGRKVLFSGTPCQIAGLKHLLNKEYDNLLTVDVACHGVPSPLIWRDYLSTIAPISDISKINFRDKSTSWRGYSISIDHDKKCFIERARENKYMFAFTHNFIIRPSCFHCHAKAGQSGSDITLADYWGVQHLIPNMDDNQGTSFVCCWTENGAAFLEKIEMKKMIADYDKSIQYNPCIYISTVEPQGREAFWKDYYSTGISALQRFKPSHKKIFLRLFNKIKNIIIR